MWFCALMFSNRSACCVHALRRGTNFAAQICDCCWDEHSAGDGMSIVWEIGTETGCPRVDGFDCLVVHLPKRILAAGIQQRNDYWKRSCAEESNAGKLHQ